MPPRLFPYAFLLSLGFISTFAKQDIRYYQDILPDLSAEDIDLKQIERWLKASRPYQHLDDSRGINKEVQERRDFERQQQALRDALMVKSNIHGLPKRRQKHIPNYPLSQIPDGLEESPILREYSGRNPREFHPYYRLYPDADIAEPFTETKTQRLLQDVEYNPTAADRSPNHHQEIGEEGMKEELDFGRKYISPHGQLNQEQHHSGGAIDGHEKFTFNYDGVNKWGDGSPFVRPDQVGYYDSEDPAVPATGVHDPDRENERTDGISVKDEDEDSVSPVKDITAEIKIFEQSMQNNAKNNDLSAFDRADRADNQSPSVMAVDHKMSNDIYFVAVVAGCSAAAMFILVLISLTWCRLQRGAKAAADVEYPAYGVTGPNKDMSPSGDRRLAQSAQMYHYQHQKQQIIAMESRTATARDPGSVSEAESDEENEEGDYTVYECPGLAPTGEMEVKNPLFHDDPTPATPAGQGQNKRSSEDHM